METYLFFMLVGALSGIIAGLFGVGGGVIVVPALIFTFLGLGFSPEVLTHMAVATSLAAMVVTAASSAYAHHNRKGVLWSVFSWMAAGVVLGAFAGVAGSLQLKGAWIQISFAVYLLTVGLRILVSRTQVCQRTMPKNFVQSLVGTVIGGISMVFGIGGGSMTVPYLMRYGVSPRQAVGTSAALGFPIAVFGALLYGVASGSSQLPEHTIGYVYLPAFVGLVLLGIPFTRLGANIAHKLPEQQLKRVFAVFAILMAMLLLMRNLG